MKVQKRGLLRGLLSRGLLSRELLSRGVVSRGVLSREICPAWEVQKKDIVQLVNPWNCKIEVTRCATGLQLVILGVLDCLEVAFFVPRKEGYLLSRVGDRPTATILQREMTYLAFSYGS